MANITIDTKGIDKLQRKLGGDIAGKALKRIVTKVAITGENEGKKRSPHDRNRLRASITHRVNGLSGWAGTNVKYGKYLDQPVTRQPHYRTTAFAGQPTAGWLTEHAFDATAKQAQEITDDEVKSIEAAWRL